MSINAKQKQHLKALAHALKPVVMVGTNGLTQAVLDEIENAIGHHELIKVKLNIGDRDERQSAAQTISSNLNADLVQMIGHVGVFYRASDKNKIQLP